MCDVAVRRGDKSVMALQPNAQSANRLELSGSKPPVTIQVKANNIAMSGFVNTDHELREGIIEGDEKDYNRYANDDANGIFENGESFWFKFEENRDEQSDERENQEFDNNYGKRQETDIIFPSKTARAHDVSEQTPTTHSVLRKWESIIRANHGVEYFENRIEFDENDEPCSRSYISRPVGVLTNGLIKSTPTKIRRSIGLDDITNSLNTPTSTTQLHASDDGGIKSESNTKEGAKPRKSFERHRPRPILTCSSPKDVKNGTDVSQMARVRRSFGLSDYVEGLDTPSATRNDRTDGTDIKKVSLRDRSTTSRNGDFKASDRDDSNAHDPKVRGIVDSKESDTKFGKLLGMWNTRIEDDNCSNKFRTDSPSPRSNLKREKVKCTVKADNHERKNSVGTNEKQVRTLVIVEHPNKCDLLVGETRRNYEGEDVLIIQNVKTKTKGIECECECSRSVFSGKEDLISFFLPKMGMACSCGRKRYRLAKPHDPTRLENIMRPWQVEFLASLGIKRGDELVKARHRSADIMATAMRQWRKKQGMTSFKTSACATALHIWSKICKSYVRFVRRQIQAGNDNFEYGPPDGVLFSEMSQFLDDLPAAPKRRSRVVEDSDDFEPGSQVEV